MLALWLAVLCAASGGKEAQAFRLFEQSEQLYREGKFREAAELLERAYALDPEPTLLFNRARALESAGEIEAAVDVYASYLEKSPKAPDRLTVERRIETMRRQIAERAELERLREEEAKRKTVTESPKLELPARPPPIAEPVVEQPSSSSPVPWLMVGVGVAGVIAGGVLGIVAGGKKSDALDEPVQLTAAGLADSARTFQTGANVAYISGGAIAAGGLIWALLAD